MCLPWKRRKEGERVREFKENEKGMRKGEKADKSYQTLRGEGSSEIFSDH